VIHPLALVVAWSLAAVPAPPAAVGDSLPLVLRPAGVVATSAAGRGQVIEPSGVATDAFGRVYVSDAALHRLQRFDARGLWLGEAGVLGSGPGELRRPGAVALLGTLSVAVLDRENRRIVTYDLFGRLIGVLVDLLDDALASEVGRIDPSALAADRGGALYLVDADRDRLLVFDFSGRFLRSVGGFGARPGSFRGLAGVATTPRGELVTAERANRRVQRLDAGGRVVATWPLVVRPGGAALPVAVDDSSRVAVADEAGGRLWVFDGRGRPLAALAGLDGPRALAFAPDGTLLVAEASAGRVSRLKLVPASRPPVAPGE